ncbi:MAG: hypothetical protein PHE49_05005 [bacterium]|nr:hypothetical protein [bacterium]
MNNKIEKLGNNKNGMDSRHRLSGVFDFRGNDKSSNRSKQDACITICLIGFALSVLFFAGCKNKSSNIQVQTEDFTKMEGYIFSENYAYLINFEKNSIAAKVRLPSKIREVCATGDNVFLIGDYLMQLSKGKFNKIATLSKDFRQVYKTDTDVYILNKTKIIALKSGLTIPLSEEPIKFSVEFDKIWVLDKNGVSVYNLLSSVESGRDAKENQRIPVDGATDFMLAPYGIRVYIAKQGFIDVFDTQNFTLITHIPIKGIPHKILFSPTTDKIYCVTEVDASTNETMVYMINRSLNKVENILRIDNVKDFYLSQNGSYGMILTDSLSTDEPGAIHILNTETNKIINKIALTVNDITTSVGDSRIYCLTPTELIYIPALSALGGKAEEPEPTFRIKVDGGNKIIILSKIDTKIETIDDKFFVLQIGIAKDSVNYAKGLLQKNCYPVWECQFANDYKLRVGFFRTREDADLFGKRVRAIIPNPIEIIKTQAESSKVAVTDIRDLNQNGLSDVAIQEDGKDIIIFEIQNGIYTEIYRCSKDEPTYNGDPAFTNIPDGNGTKLAIKTPMINGKTSIIEFSVKEGTDKKEGVFMERIE